MYPPQGKSLSSMRGRQGGAPGKNLFELDFLFLPVYPGLCKLVLGGCLQMVYQLYQASVFQRMVSKNQFSTSCSDDFEMLLANQIFELLESRLVGHKIVAL